VTDVAPEPRPARRARETAEPGGWIVFAACVLFIAGSLDALWGLAGVLNDEVVTVGGAGVIVWDFTVWGWVHLILGIVMVATALGLFAMADWARWAGVVLAILSAILQIGVITAFPLWAFLVIVLDVIVIYQLTARWTR
jgi:hypothetical protein